MLELVNAERESLLATFGMSRRLALRIETLSRQQIFVTATVAEEAVRHAPLSQLLLDKNLLVENALFENAWNTLILQPVYAEIQNDLALQLCRFAEGQWAIALEEEVAASGFASPESADASPSHSLPMPVFPSFGQKGAVPTASSRVTASHDESAPAAQITELRMMVFAGETSAQRVSALRKILYLPLSTEERAEIFLNALAEPDGALRSAASAALRHLGLRADVAEALRLLADGDVEEKVYACRQLGQLSEQSPEQECLAALMAALGLLRSSDADGLASHVVPILGACAPGLSSFQNLFPDVCRILIELVVADERTMGVSVRGALLRFLEAHPEFVFNHLLEESRKTSELPLRAFLLTVLAHAPIPDILKNSIWDDVLACVMSLPADDSFVHMLGGFLVVEDIERLHALLDAIDRSDLAHQRFFIRILDNGLRGRKRSEAFSERLAQTILRLLRTGSRNLRADLFQTRMLSGGGVPAELARELARELLRDLSTFALPYVHEQVEFALLHLGAPVLPELCEVAAKDHSVEASVACRAIGRIALSLDSNDPAMRVLLEETMRSLQRQVFSVKKVPDMLWVAMGMVYATGVFEPRIRSVICRTLEKHVTGTIEDAPLLRAFGWIAMAPNEPEETLLAVASLAESYLQKDPTIAGMTQEVNAQGEDVFLLDEEVEFFACLVPAAIEAIERVATAPAASQDLRARLVGLFLDIWKRCDRFEVQWSPANVMALTEALGVMGRFEGIGPERRRDIVRTLGHRITELPVMLVIAKVLEVSDADPELTMLAGAATTRILSLLQADHTISDEDRAIHLQALARLCRRGVIHTDPAESEAILIQAVMAIVSGVGDGIDGCLGALQHIRTSQHLPSGVRQHVDKALARFGAVQVVA